MTILQHYKFYHKFIIFLLTYIKRKKIRNNDLIVSIASFPERINDIYLCIQSILCQTEPAYKIILNLEEVEFPNKEMDLPRSLLRLQKFGLEIYWCKNNEARGSYKKLIPTLNRFPDHPIVTMDDDVIYDKNCLKYLWESYIENRDVVHFHRGVELLLMRMAI